MQCFDFFSSNHLWESSNLRHSMPDIVVKVCDSFRPVSTDKKSVVARILNDCMGRHLAHESTMVMFF